MSTIDPSSLHQNPNNNHTVQKPKIIVIGAGISGLTTASRLVDTKKFDVILLEASKRLGGRVCSEKFGGYNIEIGAQWVHGQKGNSIYRLAAPFDVLDPEKSPAKYGPNTYYVMQNGQFLADDISDKVFKIMEKFHFDKKPENSSESLGNYATKIFWETNEEIKLNPDKEVCSSILDWIQRYQNNVDGSDSWYDVSCLGQYEYESCGGNPIVPWKSPASYSTLCNIILFGCLENEEEVLPDWIKFDKIVSNIEYSTNSEKLVNVSCQDGTNYEADHVICTVSLGVLKQHHKTLFCPPLSKKRINAIENNGFGTVDKIYIEFNTQWWPEGSLGFNLLWSDAALYWDAQVNKSESDLLKEVDGIPIWCRGILGFYAIENPKALQAWLTGPAARIMENLDIYAVQSALVKVLKKFVGSTFTISEPTRITRSSWQNNQWTLGSYSFRTVESELNNAWAHQLADPIIGPDSKPILCFAGEATHSHFYSTVHGAHDTGIREADRLVEYYKCVETVKQSGIPGSVGKLCCPPNNLA